MLKVSPWWCHTSPFWPPVTQGCTDPGERQMQLPPPCAKVAWATCDARLLLPPSAKVAHAAPFNINFNIQAEVMALEQSLATAHFQREEGSQALASAREQMAQQLAHASDLEATRVQLMRRQGELAVVRAPRRTPHTAHRTLHAARCTCTMHHAPCVQSGSCPAQAAGVEAHRTHISARIARHRAELEQMEVRLQQEFAAQLARTESQRHQELSAFPKYIQNLLLAEKLGHAADHQASIDIISGLATCLAKNSTAGRRLNETEKFYGILLNSQSPWAEKFVSHNLMGPNLRYIKRLRSERAPDIALAVGEAAVRDVLLPLLVDHGVREIPGGICEDGTSCNRKLDWERAQESSEPEVAAAEVENEASRRAILAREDARQAQAGGGARGASAELGEAVDERREFAPAEHVSEATWRRGIKIWGMVDGPFTVHSLAELRALFTSKTKVIARYVYTYTWVPTAKHAPWFPFIMLASDNKFTGEWCWRMWRRLHKACAAQLVPQTWHGSDGDSRMRLCDYVMNLYLNRDKNGGWCDGR